jgi:hypothetical protein
MTAPWASSSRALSPDRHESRLHNEKDRGATAVFQARNEQFG